MKTNPLQQNRNRVAVCIAFFVGFILFSIFRAKFQSIDNVVNLWTATIHTDTATLIAKCVHFALGTIAIAVASITIAGFLLIKSRKTQSLLLLAAVSGNALFVATIKTITQVIRPENQILHVASFSYPSGHCAGAIVFIGLLTYYIWLKWGSGQRIKILSTAIFGLVVAFVSFDRIYLNVHWLSDVIGGCLLGAFWLSFCVIFYERLKRDNNVDSQSV